MSAAISIRRFHTDFSRAVSANRRSVALVSGLDGREWSYSDLDELIDRVGAFLAETVGEPPRPVVSLLPNSIDNLVIFLSTIKFKLDFAPIGPEATPIEVRRWIGMVGAGLCLVTPHIGSDVAAEIESSGVRVVSLVANGRFEWLGGQARAAPSRDSEELETTRSRLFLTSSGTTGQPKALVFDSDRLWSSGVAFTSHFGFLDQDACFLNILPMSYLGGLFNLGLIPLSTGGRVVVSEAFSGRSFLKFWQDVERFDVNVLWLVPSIVRGLVALSRPARRQRLHGMKLGIRAGFLGTAPIDLATKLCFEEEFGIPLLENYALSETTFLTSETLDTRFRRCNQSVGEVLPYVDLRLVENKAYEGKGSPLEIQARTPFLFLGYLRDDGEIDLPLTDDGFLPTGDLGHLEHDDMLVLDGRTREIIKKGGYLVSLTEIEATAQDHPTVAEAAAVSVPHDFYGETFVLFVRFNEEGTHKDGGSIDIVRSWMTNRLSKHKWPQDIVIVKDFPRTPSGKIQKHRLVEGTSLHR